MSVSVIYIVSFLSHFREVYLEGKEEDNDGGTKHDCRRGIAVGLVRGTLGTNVVPLTIQSLHLMRGCGQRGMGLKNELGDSMLRMCCSIEV